MQLITALEDIARKRNKGSNVDIMIQDFSKDTVPHRRLMSKCSVRVESGVPQGTVLGPLLFLLFINDITMQIDSNLRLFAEDCLLYEEVNDSVMVENLQMNLDLLGEWAEKWQMSFNVSKYYHMSTGPKGNIPVTVPM